MVSPELKLKAPSFSHSWLLFLFAGCIISGCGHKQQLHTASFIPTLQHVQSTPEGFELWFSPADGKQVAVWTRGSQAAEEGNATTGGPMLLKTQQDILEIRFAYVQLGEVKVLSPWTHLYRIEAPPYPAIRCKIMKGGTHIEWSSQEPPSYKSWYLYHGKGLWIGPISAKNRIHKTNAVLENVFIEWHSDGVRGRRMPLNCMH